MNPIHAFSLKGKIVTAVLRFLFFLVYLFKGKKWSRPRENFSEDPLHYTFSDAIYFGYKYYYKPHVKYIDSYSSQKLNTSFVPPVVPSEATVVSITAGGDLMPYEWIKKEFCANLWDEVGARFFSSDIVFANLETPIDTAHPVGLVPELMLNHMEFNGDKAMFDVFNGNSIFKGFDVLSVANNHSFDKGEEGVIKTISFLQSQNIQSCGTAATLEEQDHFPILERDGIKIAFLAYTYSLNHLELPLDKAYLCNHLPLNIVGCDLSLIKKQVLAAHQRGADFVIASVHYGNAYQLFPSDHFIQNTHRLFDECGVDMVFGGHAHNLQPIEYYHYTCPITNIKKQGLATYCMGDFVAYDIFTWGHLPIWLKIEIAKINDRVVIKNVEVNPIYTCGIYKNSRSRELRFLDARKLWAKIEQAEETGLPSFNENEVRYLKTIYDKVFFNGPLQVK